MTDWSEAPCQGLGHLFYAEGHALAARLAKRMCWSCPFREPCLAEAERYHDYDGIWGGTLPSERMVDGVRHGTPAGYAWHLRERRRDPSHEPCEPCRRANTAVTLERRARSQTRSLVAQTQT